MLHGVVRPLEKVIRRGHSPIVRWGLKRLEQSRHLLLASHRPRKVSEMKNTFWLLGGMLFCVVLVGCGGMATRGPTVGSGSGCVIAEVTPPSAVADHAAAPPGNEVQFSTTVLKGNGEPCPQIVTAGVWTTSDPVNTSISNQAPTQGLATCLNITPSPATINYTGTIYGQPYAPATLTCN